MVINVAHWYLHLGDNVLRLTYGDLRIKLKATLEVCDGCVISKAKACAVRKKTSTQSTKPGERIFVDTNGPLPGILI